MFSRDKEINTPHWTMLPSAINVDEKFKESEESESEATRSFLGNSINKQISAMKQKLSIKHYFPVAFVIRTQTEFHDIFKLILSNLY